MASPALKPLAGAALAGEVYGERPTAAVASSLSLHDKARLASMIRRMRRATHGVAYAAEVDNSRVLKMVAGNIAVRHNVQCVTYFYSANVHDGQRRL